MQGVVTNRTRTNRVEMNRKLTGLVGAMATTVMATASFAYLRTIFSHDVFLWPAVFLGGMILGAFCSLIIAPFFERMRDFWFFAGACGLSLTFFFSAIGLIGLIVQTSDGFFGCTDGSEVVQSVTIMFVTGFLAGVGHRLGTMCIR